MHEHAIVQNIVETLATSAKKENILPGQVREVVMKVGELEFHTEAAFRQTFEVLIRGTLLEGATLNLSVLRPMLKCPDCGFSGPCREGEADPHSPMPCGECPSCGKVVPITGGRGVEGLELVLKE